MPSAHRESVRDFATVKQDIRDDIVLQIVERRNALGLTTSQLSEAARITEMDLQAIERGYVWGNSHLVVCDILVALIELEEAANPSSIMRLVSMQNNKN